MEIVRRAAIIAAAIILAGCATTKVLERYDTGEVKSRGRYKNHELDGEVLTYFRNGQLWKRENYKNGELDGVREYYYEDYVPEADGTFRPVGQLETRSTYQMGYQVGKEEGFYRNGQPHTERYYSKQPTVWREWYESGELKFEGDFVDGSGHGKWTYYREDGTVSEVMTLVDGRQEGVSETYHPNGKTNYHLVYRDGEVVERHVWDEQGDEIMLWRIPVDNTPLELPALPEEPQDVLMHERNRLQQSLNDAIMSGNSDRINNAERAYDEFMAAHEEDFLDFIIMVFSADERDGEFKEYYSTGELKIVTPRSKGEHHGVQKVFYKNGSLAASVEYKRGKEDGPYHRFYRNGQIEVEGQMLKGDCVGVWKIYNPDGSLREKRDYNKLK